jgi:hypothetical protein
MNLSKAIFALLLGASTVLASSGSLARFISKNEISEVTQIIDQLDDQPEQLVELFKDRRLRYSKDTKHLLVTMISWYQPRLFKRLFKLIEFKSDCRDGVLSRLFEVAIFMSNAEVCAFLLKQGFQYARKTRDPWRREDMNSRISYRPGMKLQTWDLDAFKKLVSDYSGIAAAICPQPQESIDPEKLLFWIEAAHHCATVSGNPAVFDPTAWIKVVFHCHHGAVIFDELMCRLYELGAEVEQRIIDTVKQNCLALPQTYRYLQSQDFIDPASSPFPADANGLYDLKLYDNMTLSCILRHDEIPETVMALLDECRFAFSYEMNNLLGCTISLNRPASFAFLFERTNFNGESRDDVMTDLLKHAFGNESTEIYHLLLDQDFRIKSGYNVFFNLEGWGVERATELLTAHPQRAVDMSPYPESLQFHRNAEHGRLLINLAAHCNPVEFRPSDYLASLVRNLFLSDADMASAIRQLCELGARVEPSIYETFARNRLQVYAESRKALQEHEALQDEVKEPGSD